MEDGQKLNIKGKLKQNLGLINLFGKSSGRLMYLIVLVYFNKELPVNVFADFAIFWTGLRLFTFYAANNIYIISFNSVRTSLLEQQMFPRHIMYNSLYTLLLFLVPISIISYFIFDSWLIAGCMALCVICNVFIRNLVEYAKADNNLYLSIFVDDFLFYFLFLFFGFGTLYLGDSLELVIYSMVLASVLAALAGVVLFAAKFRLKIKTIQPQLPGFDRNTFFLGLNYTFLRGNEVLSNFGVRYFGQIYFGDVFVSYVHIMYQFYNIIALLTIAVISGFQSKIVVSDLRHFTTKFISRTYSRLIKTILPFTVGVVVLIGVFRDLILTVFFPRYSDYADLLLLVCAAALTLSIIQPLVFIFIYNNKFSNLKTLNVFQYVMLLLLIALPWLYSGTAQNVWLILMMISLTLVQGLFALFNFRKHI